MALLNEESIRTLASFKAPDRPVVTAYLDVDGKRWPKYADVEARFDRLVREAADAAGSNGHAATAVPDLQKIQGHLRSGIDRSRTRGLAFFACGDALWQVHQLPVRVKDQLVVNQTPHVRQLEGIIDNYKGFGLLLADKQRTRMFVFELNELVDKSEVFEALPRHPDDVGDRDRGHERSDLDETAAHQHLKRAAQTAFDVWKQHPFDHLILSAAPEITHELEADLHSYLKERIRARINIPASAPESVIVDAVLDVEEQVERDREAAMVNRVREAAASGRGGVAGLEATLAAMSERRVDTLVVSDGFEVEGWRCDSCGVLACKGRTCPTCGEQMEHVDDVVEEAVEQALLQSCHVEMCVGNADLDVAGRIGALLRF